MALVNKQRLTIGLKPETIEFIKKESEKMGISMSVYIDLMVQNIMKESKKDS